MPRKLVRYQQTGSDLHFITFSCYRRQAWLGTAEARDLFEKSLETMRLRYDFWITGYVVMPEHVHLLVSEPPVILLSKVLQALKLSVAVQRCERPFWQARYYDFNVFTARKVEEKLHYIHMNPVAAGLVRAPAEWRWSSYRTYVFGESGLVDVTVASEVVGGRRW